MTTSTFEKQAPNPRRTTFLAGRDVLERSRRALERARGALGRAPAQDARARLLVDSLESLQTELAEALGRFAETAPDELLNDRSQYTPEVPAELEGPEQPAGDLDAVMGWTLALVGSLAHRFRELAEASTHAESLQEAYANLAVLVEGYEKRIARLAEGEHDL